MARQSKKITVKQANEELDKLGNIIYDTQANVDPEVASGLSAVINEPHESDNSTQDFYY